MPEASGSLVSLIRAALETAHAHSRVMSGVPGVNRGLGLAPYGQAPAPGEARPRPLVPDVVGDAGIADLLPTMALRRRPPPLPPPFGPLVPADQQIYDPSTHGLVHG